ncbi:MAG: hypothetical protein OXD00_03820 [Gammaproteobacteria bacterium]|nr:hypothetical protein [Gammaproteobacteria bacterium]
MTAVSSIGRQDVQIEAGTLLGELCEQLTARSSGVVGCIAYGSCLRSGKVFDGLVDVYLVVAGYQAAHSSRLAALFNWLLPPNVYYAEVPLASGVARVKYSILSLKDLQRGCSQRFESYLWGRFAQPVGLFGFASENDGARVRNALEHAGQRLIRESVALCQAEFTSRELITAGLSKSYATELRAEKTGRVMEIYDSAKGHYRSLCDACLPDVGNVEQVSDDCWRSRLGAASRRVLRGKWLLRQVLGKLASIARLLKAYFTFRDGISYLAWKLSRHSGQEIVVPARVRRFPLVFGWSFFLRLYRQGVFK